MRWRFRGIEFEPYTRRLFGAVTQHRLGRPDGKVLEFLLEKRFRKERYKNEQIVDYAWGAKGGLDDLHHSIKRLRDIFEDDGCEPFIVSGPYTIVPEVEYVGESDRTLQAEDAPSGSVVPATSQPTLDSKETACSGKEDGSLSGSLADGQIAGSLANNGHLDHLHDESLSKLSPSTRGRFATLIPRFATLILSSLICLSVASDQFQSRDISIQSGHAPTPKASNLDNMGTPRTKILVLEFNGPEPNKYLGHTIATVLELAKLNTREDIDIEGSDQVISEAGDAAADEARRIGRAKNATAVIWGYMGSTQDAPFYASYVPVISNKEVQWPMTFGEQAALMRLPMGRLEDLGSQYQLAEKFATLVRITVGLARLQRGDFDGFAQEIDQAIKNNPANNELVGSGDLFLYRAFARVLMFDVANARKDLVMASTRTNDDKLRAIALSMEAAIDAEQLDFARFNSLCEQVHQISGAPLDAISLCGEGYWQFGDEKDSAVFLGNILTKVNPTPVELPSRIRLHIALCELDKAKDDLEYARRIGDDDPSLNEFDHERIELATKSQPGHGSSLPPDMNGFTLLTTANRYMGTKQFGLALLAVNELIRRVPSVAAYATRAGIEALTGDTKRSIQDLDQAIEREPSAYLYELRAGEYDDDKAYNEELADLDMASHLDPSDASIELSIASALFEVGRRHEGYKHLRNALSLEPTYAVAYFQLGEEQLADLAYSDSQRSFTSEINLIRGKTPPFGFPLAHATGSCSSDPNRMRRDYYVSALVLRSSAEMRSGQYSPADHDLQEAIHLDPSASNSYAMDSLHAEEENDYQRALAEIDKAIALDGTNKNYVALREGILEEMKVRK